MALTKGKIIGFNVLIQRASLAAQEATDGFDEFDEPDHSFNCGFAWIVLPGRGDFASYLKKFRGACKNYGSKGIVLWYSNVYNSRGSQSMTKHRIACDAFAEVLRNNGFECVVESRLD